MNWSKTKSIFIICFLLLDAFLVFEIYHSQDGESIGGIAGDSQEESIFNNKGIKWDANIPETPGNITFLQGRLMNLSSVKKDLESNKNPGPGLPIRKIMLENDGMVIRGVFNKPAAIAPEKEDQLGSLLESVFNGQQYRYWRTDESSGMVHFVQTYEDRPVYLSKHSNIQMLGFTMDHGKVTGYRQSYFNFEKTNTVNIISARDALNYLATKNELSVAQHPEVEMVELSYVNLVGDAGSDPLVFVPAWHVVVKKDSGTEEFFVNAVSISIQTLD
ncbi:hypothetical protein EWH99_09505 [Sporolactobacillus sp. THM7-7]|nr:hypothetical protein EWH99_09505 [Sporolactobacillus sp. THM7-7]